VSGPRARFAAAVGGVLAVVLAGPAAAQTASDRTFTVSRGINGTAADGASARPAIDGKGRVVAFDSVASNLALDVNGAVRDVFAHDLGENDVRLISDAPGGANGASRAPAVSQGGSVVAFESDASNLVPGDANGVRDVFARHRMGPVVRVSLSASGGDADGPSSEADVSANGRYVVFTSSATNLVADDTNGASDVFVRDLQRGTTTLVSIGRSADADGPSNTPAISPDGRYVAFFSAASNLVSGDTNEIADVFVADLRTKKVERVSVSSRNRQQNRSVIAPFTQVSDISDRGRFVAFDSDATNLVPGDSNKDTDVFVRDRIRRRTVRISVDPNGRQTNNDSFYPAISADGRYVAFQSFAANLSRDDIPGQDTFVYDLGVFAPALVTVTSRGGRRAPEAARQVVQQPSVTDTGQFAVFTSTAQNLVAEDSNGADDVFLRILRRPTAQFTQAPRAVERTARPRFAMRARPRSAKRFICAVDGRRFPCGASGRTPPLRPGVHVLKVRAGGPGMLYQTKPLTRRFLVAR
jgi:Tol biopolymer transport system component